MKNYTHILSYVFSFLWQQKKITKLRFGLAILCTAVAVMVNVLLPVILKQIVEFSDLSDSPHLSFLVLLTAYCIMWVISRVIFSLREMLVVRVVERSIRNLSRDFVAHLYTLPMTFHLNQKIGDITNMLEKASSALPIIIYGFFFFFIPTTLEIIIAIILFFNFYGTGYAALLGGVFLAFIMFSMYASKNRVAYRKESNKIHGQVASHLTDVLLNFEMISYFGTQQYELSQYDQLLHQKENAQTKSHLAFETMYLGNSIIIGIGFTLFTLLIGREILVGTKSVSDLMLIHGFLIQFFLPLGAFGIILRDSYRSFTDIERAITIMDMPSIDQKFQPALVDIKDINGIIEFRNVTFAYESKPPILENASFKIPAGRMIGLIGETGAGKSTIIKLLYRFYEVLEGEILIDGKNIKKISHTTLTRMFGIVPQDPFLFNNSIAYNICYGQPNTSTKELVTAAERAQIHHAIKMFPQQYETTVGEQGTKLSRGERQRIALARAFLKNPSIYIFDEATASLDEQTQTKIIDQLPELCARKTTLVITHHPSQLKGIDRWLKLERGKIYSN